MVLLARVAERDAMLATLLEEQWADEAAKRDEVQAAKGG